MDWRNYFRRGSPKPPSEVLKCVRLALPEWTEDAGTETERAWHDVDGDLLALSNCSEPLADSDRNDDTRLRRWCRGAAEERHGGLIEVQRLDDTIKFICKLRNKQNLACIYTGMLLARTRRTWFLWAIVSGERGMTGIREAVVTANLISEGKFTLESYERDWAQDPYEPTYRGVPRNVLRFESDDERYDEMFPQHPLSKVRRNLVALSTNVKYDS